MLFSTTLRNSDPFESVDIEPLWLSSSMNEGAIDDDMTLEAIMSKMGNNEGNSNDSSNQLWNDIQELYNSMGGKGSIHNYQI